MKKLLLSLVLVIGSVIAVVAQTSNDESSKPSPSEFSGVSLTYDANPVHFDLGSYGVKWNLYTNSGLNFLLHFSANYGILPVDCGTISSSIGVGYAYVINKYILLNAPIVGSFFPTSSFTESFTGDKFGGGVGIIPQACFRFKPVLIGIGYSVGGSFTGSNASFAHGLHLSVGIHF